MQRATLMKELTACATVAFEASIGESRLSQNQAISEQLSNLKKRNSETELPKLKALIVNKLFELAKLRDDSKLVRGVTKSVTST